MEKDEWGGRRQETAAISSREVVMTWTGKWEEGRGWRPQQQRKSPDTSSLPRIMVIIVLGANSGLYLLIYPSAALQHKCCYHPILQLGKLRYKEVKVTCPRFPT